MLVGAAAGALPGAEAAGWSTIADVTKARIRGAGVTAKAKNAAHTGDTGFRVYKLDQSNIRAWQPSGDLDKDLIDSVEHIVPGRSEQDVLTELLLKLGLDLCVPIEQRQIAGKAVHAIGSGVLLACLDTRISKQDAEPWPGLAEWHQALAPAGETTCVFRDSALRTTRPRPTSLRSIDQHGPSMCEACEAGMTACAILNQRPEIQKVHHVESGKDP